MTTSKIIIISLSIIVFIALIFLSIKTMSTLSLNQSANSTNQSQVVDDDHATTNDTSTMNQENETNNTSSEITAENFSHLVTIETNLGVIKFKTYDADAPKTVNNFLTLANKGFYDGLIFHRVIDRFMIQGGDPTGTGAGGPGYQFEDELNPTTESYKKGYITGVVAMANAGPNTNGSQFFIMVDDVPLSHDYSIFGQVTDGQEVANAISKVKTNPSDRPLDEVKIVKVSVEKIK